MRTLTMTELGMQRGDDRVIRFTIKNAGVAVDMSAATIAFTAKLDIRDTDAAALIQKAVGSGVEVDGLGLLSVYIDAADTVELAQTTSLVWDLEIIIAGAARTPARGTLLVEYDVTRHDV